jgi:hypothetical protein
MLVVKPCQALVGLFLFGKIYKKAAYGGFLKWRYPQINYRWVLHYKLIFQFYTFVRSPSPSLIESGNVPPETPPRRQESGAAHCSSAICCDLSQKLAPARSASGGGVK